MAKFTGFWFMANTYDGTNDADDITGAGFGDLLHGGEGRDTIDGGGGDDQIFGDGGNDLLLGGKGNDTLDGGADNDTLDGGEGNDLLKGGDGNDTFRDVKGNNDIRGGAGTDTIDYSGFYDGRVVVDLSAGTARHEQVVREMSGNYNGYQSEYVLLIDKDTLSSIENATGSIGDDILAGNAFMNTIRGGFGDDTIDGGGGADRLTGGEGRDRFIFDDGDSSVRITDGFGNVTVDRITDFDLGSDVIDLSRIDANANLAGDQRFVYANNFNGDAGQLLIRQDDDHNFRLVGDTNGDGVGDVFIDFYEVGGGSSPGNLMFYSDSNLPRDQSFIWL